MQFQPHQSMQPYNQQQQQQQYQQLSQQPLHSYQQRSSEEAISNQSILHESEVSTDVIEQADSHRLHANRVGLCHIATNLQKNGTFWIRPVYDRKIDEHFAALSSLIGNFVDVYHLAPYSSTMGSGPFLRKDDKCFIRVKVCALTHHSFKQKKNLEYD